MDDLNQLCGLCYGVIPKWNYNTHLYVSIFDLRIIHNLRNIVHFNVDEHHAREKVHRYQGVCIVLMRTALHDANSGAAIKNISCNLLI